MSKKDISFGDVCRTIISETSEAILDFVSSIGQPKDEKPKRARTKSGKYRADDKTTKGINEAWVGGKAPKKKSKKKK